MRDREDAFTYGDITERTAAMDDLLRQAIGSMGGEQLDSPDVPKATAQSRLEPTELDTARAKVSGDALGGGIHVMLEVPYLGTSTEALNYTTPVGSPLMAGAEHLDDSWRYGAGWLVTQKLWTHLPTASQVQAWRDGAVGDLKAQVEATNRVIRQHNDGLEALAAELVQKRRERTDKVQALLSEINHPDF